MRGSVYYIHNFLEIHVSSRVSQDITKMLDFQLGGLKDMCTDRPAGYKIFIKPYSEFRFKPGATIINLWKASGVIGSSFNDPEEELAFAKGENSFVIYANRRNFAINMFIQLVLIRHGTSLLTAAGLVDKNNNATLLTGAGNTGKTSITLSAVKNGKYCLLGDDTICITSTGYGLSYPREFTIKDYHRLQFPEYFSVSKIPKERGLKAYTKNTSKQIIRNMPFLGLLNFLLHKLDQPGLRKRLIPEFFPRQPNGVLCTLPLDKIYGQDKVVSRANIDRVVYLERYNGNSLTTTPMDPENLAARLCALLNNEWALKARQLYLMSVLELLDFRDYFSQSRQIIYEAIKNSPCDCFRIPGGCTPEALSKYYLSKYSD